tara:strand:- start:960 stop:1088 length:129 start_codon:yes stop_codon:yes gene_type:complete
MRNLLFVALVVVFNDFVGAVLAFVGSLLIKVGHLIAQIPAIF